MALEQDAAWKAVRKFFVIFIVFTLAGGLFLYHFPFLLGVHVTVLIYSVILLASHLKCPLTTLEIAFRRKSGEEVEWHSFIHHYMWVGRGKL